VTGSRQRFRSAARMNPFIRPLLDLVATVPCVATDGILTQLAHEKKGQFQ
jgi:hypothetical protein